MRTYTIVIGSAALIAALAVAQSRRDSNPRQWSLAGQGLHNSRSQPAETQIDPSNVASLTPKWTFTTGGDVSATPTVFGDNVYFPDWAGNLFAVQKDSGQLVWSHQISEYDGVPGAFSRVSPAIHGNDLVIGDILSETAAHNGANLMAIDRASGQLRWITQVDTHPMAIISGSPAVLGDVVFVGISSIEEVVATADSYACCTFRGSIVALNAFTGEILWKTYDMPDNAGQPGGYSGGAIWQPPAIDAGRNLLYIGTGNNYSVPTDVLSCASANPTTDCTVPNNFFDSALALDVRTGQIRWATKLGTFDAWNRSCGAKGINCPSPAGADYDLGGSGPNLLPDLVGFGQKNGMYWALNPDTGAVLWNTVVGPAGTLGGIQWGTATDGASVYAAISNNGHIPYTLIPNGGTTNAGLWSALDVATGKILWQTADPDGAIDPGSVSVANNVVYAGSYSGKMLALDAATGHVLWSFASGGSVMDGPSIVDGVLYWGCGYRRISPGIGNNQLYAFSLN